MNSFGLYVHWPYCVRKCPYCDFNSYSRPSRDEEGWCDAILTEMAHVAGLQSGKRPVLGSIFFGGGTPSLMEGRTAGRIVAEAAKHWAFAENIEITLEANPASTEAARFADYSSAGVNRLSLGVQSLRDDALKTLGRLHDAAEAKSALALALQVFPRVSFDLIYARPGQTVGQWQIELAEALAFGAGHLSLYQLTIEPGTPFAALHARGALPVPEEDAAAALYEVTQSMAEAAGLAAYEISNHARPGEESRHNLNYWRYGDYAGVGPGAHGRLELSGRRFATVCERHSERWLEQVKRLGHGFAAMDEISPLDAAREHLLMNLRLTEGLDVEAFQARWGVALPADKIASLAALGLVRHENGRLGTTPRGALVLNRVIAELTP
jgi:putative oxygen-independent coproporphyrinogen III oxidase